MTGVRIRPAEAGDVPVRLGLVRALAAHEGSGSQLLTDAEVLLRDGFGGAAQFGALLAEIDGIAVGFVSYTVNYSIWAGGQFLQVDDLYVDGARRGAGIGHRLMEAVGKVCLRRGCGFVRWTVELRNTGAIAFYERLGASLRAKGVCTWRPDAAGAIGGD
jgi:GNAT superfamily N-acetyltransferase